MTNLGIAAEGETSYLFEWRPSHAAPPGHSFGSDAVPFEGPSVMNKLE